MTMNKVAFIIVCWHNADLLKECLDSIQKQTYKEHVTIMVDNGSKDDSIAVAKKHMPDIRILDTGINHGFAKGNNIGIQEALQDPEVGYVALLNTDARLDPDWLQKIIAFTKQKPKAALLQGTTFDYYDPRIIDSTHIYIARNGQGTQGSWRDYDTAEFGPKKVFGVNAAACVITRAFIDAQPFGEELFDETMFMYLEDVDLGTRATLMGWDNYLVPGAKALHMGSASSGKNPGFSLYMTFRNNSALLYKNFSWPLLFKIIPRLVQGDIDTVRHLRSLGKEDAARKVINGRLIGILRLPLFMKKRRIMRKARKIHSDYIWTLMKKGY
jgi:GT2 family glycosyltransferase